MSPAPLVSRNSAHRRRQLGADASLLLVAVIWGSTFVLVKQAVAQVGVFTFLGLRFLLAAAALAFLVRPAWTRASASALRAGVLVGLFLFGGYALQTLGLRLTSASKAGFITGLFVVIVPLLSALMLRRLPARSAWAGVALATAGLGLLTLKDPAQTGINWGDLLVLGCALCFALHILALGRYAPHFDPSLLTTVQVGLVALLSLALAMGSEVVPVELGAEVWMAALFTGILATALAYWIQTSAQRLTSPTHTALLLGGEQLGLRELAGCVLILVGMLLAEVPRLTQQHQL